MSIGVSNYHASISYAENKRLLMKSLRNKGLGRSLGVALLSNEAWISVYPNDKARMLAQWCLNARHLAVSPYRSMAMHHHRKRYARARPSTQRSFLAHARISVPA